MNKGPHEKLDLGPHKGRSKYSDNSGAFYSQLTLVIMFL